MELTVIIPTWSRRPILCETLDRLGAQAGAADFEVVVVDDGSTDDTVSVVEDRAGRSGSRLRLLRQQGEGPAAARNRAVEVARAPVCLFIDDDTWPMPGLVAGHARFHRERPEREAALLGYVDVAREPPPSPFMQWLSELHLGYASISDPENAGGDHFFSGNVSAKTDFVRSVGGFDDGYPSAAHEDIDLGKRLEARGMRLAYDPEAAVEHYHPTDLSESIGRMYDVGFSLARFVERYPDRPVTRRPGARHRVKAAALTALAAARVSTDPIRRETWRFLCHEAAREGYWDAVDGGTRPTGSSRRRLRIGGRLARLASRDPGAQMPPPSPEFDKRQAALEEAPAR